MNSFKKILSDNLSLIVLFSFGLFLRGYGLGSKSLWYDEAFVLHESQKAFAALFNVNNEGVHPPLYRFIMHFWLYLGRGETLARAPSLIFSALGIIAGYKTAKLIFDKRIGLYTAFFIAVSPFHIYYAQEIKGYSLLFLSSLLSIYFFLKGIKGNKAGSWPGYVFFTAISIYTHYFGFLNIFAQNLFMALAYKRYEKSLARRWIIAQCLIFLLFIPWLPNCVRHFTRVADNFWIPRPSLENIFIIFKNFTMGYYTSNLSLFFLQLPLFVIFLCGCLTVVFFKSAGRNTRGWGFEEKLLSLNYLFIPLLMILALSKTIRPLYLDRTLIIVSFFYFVVLSKGIELIRKNKAIFFLTVFLMLALFTVSLKNYYRGDHFNSSVGISSKRKPFRETVKYIRSNYREGDIIVLSHYSLWPSFEYYFPDNMKSRLYLESSFGTVDSNDEYAEIGLKTSFNFKTIDVKQLEGKEDRGIWLICSFWEDFPFISRQLREWIDLHQRKLIFKSDKFRGMEVYYFR